MDSEQFKNILHNFKVAGEQLEEAVSKIAIISEELKSLSSSQESLEKQLDRFNKAPQEQAINSLFEWLKTTSSDVKAIEEKLEALSRNESSMKSSIESDAKEMNVKIGFISDHISSIESRLSNIENILLENGDMSSRENNHQDSTAE